MELLKVSVVFIVLLFSLTSAVLSRFIPNSVDNKRNTLTNRPIIGVMTQSTRGAFQKFGKSYIAASYIKYLEASGARVVPVKNDLTESEVLKLYNSINGFLLPGGGANLIDSGYAKIGRIIFNSAVKSYENGDYFPMWGSCLGLQFLCVVTSKDNHILGRTDSYNYPIPLNFSEGYEESRMFRNISKELAKFLASHPTTMNNHHYSVYTSKFKANKNLQNFFRVLSTNNGRNGIEFISTIEGLKYPIYGVQWHPEKNSFEWTINEDIPHSSMATKVTQYMSNFFVNEARYNNHKFESVEEENAALIYNYKPIYTDGISKFEQIYAFD